MPVNESNREFIFPGKPRCCGAKTIKTKLQHNTIPLPRTADGKRIENKPSLSLFLTFFSYLFPASHTFFQVSGRFNSRWFKRVVAALSSSCFDPVRNKGDVGGNNNENNKKKITRTTRGKEEFTLSTFGQRMMNRWLNPTTANLFYYYPLDASFLFYSCSFCAVYFTHYASCRLSCIESSHATPTAECLQRTQRLTNNRRKKK